jgi:hypothetical protein
VAYAVQLREITAHQCWKYRHGMVTGIMYCMTDMCTHKLQAMRMPCAKMLTTKFKNACGFSPLRTFGGIII